MKRSIVCASILLLFLTTVFTQEYVNIPDTAFLSLLIEEGVDIDGDGQISYSEAEARSILVFSSCYNGVCNISDITGIEAFVNLTALSCINNNLTSLDLSSNTKLETLNCVGNQLTSLDVSNCALLTGLACEYNQLNNLDLSNITELKIMSISNNLLTTLEISNNTELTLLSCETNQLSNLDISNNTALQLLNCSDNQLTSLDVTKNTSLSELWCGFNRIESMDVSSNPVLERFFCGKNLLTSMDVSNNTALTSLGCEENQLTSLDISTNTMIEYLDISHMETLNEVCVWESFEPDNLDILTEESPNICFQTDCNGDCSIVGIKDKELSELMIYPNPTNSLLTIESDQADNRLIEILSLSGQLIYRTEMIGSTKQVDLTSFSKGMYFVTVRSKRGVRIEKVVKM